MNWGRNARKKRVSLGFRIFSRNALTTIAGEKLPVSDFPEKMLQYHARW
jgi:hypothetical protein